VPASRHRGLRNPDSPSGQGREVFASPACSSVHWLHRTPDVPDSNQEASLNIRLTIVLALSALLALPALAQQPPRMSVESSQALFSVMAAINVCGYDADLFAVQSLALPDSRRSPPGRPIPASSVGVTQHVRILRGSPAGKRLAYPLQLCFARPQHGGRPQAGAAHPGERSASRRIFVLGFLPLLQHFSEAANLDAICSVIVPATTSSSRACASPSVKPWFHRPLPQAQSQRLRPP